MNFTNELSKFFDLSKFPNLDDAKIMQLNNSFDELVHNLSQLGDLDVPATINLIQPVIKRIALDASFDNNTAQKYSEMIATDLAARHFQNENDMALQIVKAFNINQLLEQQMPANCDIEKMRAAGNTLMTFAAFASAKYLHETGAVS